MGVSDLTFGFAALHQQQFGDAQEAFGGGQVKGAVAYLATHVLIRPKLQQQLCNLSKGGRLSDGPRVSRGKRWGLASTCSWP